MRRGRYGVPMHVYGAILPGAAAVARLLPTAVAQARGEPRLSTKARLHLKMIRWYEEHGCNARLTCRHFWTYPPTFYHWLRRYQQEGSGGLEDRSRRPHRGRQPNIGPFEPWAGKVGCATAPPEPCATALARIGRALRLWHGPDLLHEGHHVEVLTALLDLVTLELEYPGGGRGLALTRRRKRAARAVQGPRLCSLPSHLKHGFVAACEGVGNSALNVRHRLPPALERWKDLGLASELASRTHLVVKACTKQRHAPVPVPLVERFYCFLCELDEILFSHDASPSCMPTNPARRFGRRQYGWVVVSTHHLPPTDGILLERERCVKERTPTSTRRCPLLGAVIYCHLRQGLPGA